MSSIGDVVTRIQEITQRIQEIRNLEFAPNGMRAGGAAAVQSGATAQSPGAAGGAAATGTATQAVPGNKSNMTAAQALQFEDLLRQALAANESNAASASSSQDLSGLGLLQDGLDDTDSTLPDVSGLQSVLGAALTPPKSSLPGDKASQLVDYQRQLLDALRQIAPSTDQTAGL